MNNIHKNVHSPGVLRENHSHGHVSALVIEKAIQGGMQELREVFLRPLQAEFETVMPANAILARCGLTWALSMVTRRSEDNHEQVYWRQ